jgi:hypothetical protein
MIYRLIDRKRRAADAAETAHAAAHHATMTAEQRLQHAVARSNATAIRDAEQELLVARNDEAMKREVMTEARIELRRYETWLANTKELQRIEAERRTRKQA